ncbi:hypothetical protein BOX15_Mlig000519g1 [Macrostomum lignano]|nr:hypothetical protein BOX15_Mlig000519g1 [Macrostomum lignano]
MSSAIASSSSGASSAAAAAAGPQPALEIGGRFPVLRVADGQWYPAEIVHKRETADRANSQEYFIHYLDFDRRLDEWVGIDRIDVSNPAGTLESAGLDPLASSGGDKTRLTRHQKRKFHEIHHVPQSVEEMDAATAALEREHQELTKVKYIDLIQIGKYEITTWYFSPYPDEYGKQTKLWICEYCLKYMGLEKSHRYHLSQCEYRQPPGREIYRKGNLSVFEVDGKQRKLYCQCLCLLAKLFLDHKTLYFDVSGFLFYILCEVDRHGCHIVGYFSKEKDSPDSNNLACILTLPPHQRKGYGKLLISLSYELARVEGLVGGPEKPLSDLGKVTYRSYWEYAILDYIQSHPSCTVRDICSATAISRDDVQDTLHGLGLLQYWRGSYDLCLPQRTVQEHLLRILPRKPQLIDAACLQWSPLYPKSPKAEKRVR